MKFPPLLVPHVAIPDQGDFRDADVIRSLVHTLARRDAARIEMDAGSVAFDAATLAWNVSPLAACGQTRFSIARRAGQARINYGFEFDMLRGRSAACITAAAALSLWSIAYGRVAPVVIIALFYGIGLAATYFFYSAQLSRIIAFAVPSASRPAIKTRSPMSFSEDRR